MQLEWEERQLKWDSCKRVSRLDENDLDVRQARIVCLTVSYIATYVRPYAAVESWLFAAFFHGQYKHDEFKNW